MTTAPPQLAALETVASLSPMGADLVAVAIVAVVVMGVLQAARRWSRASAAPAA